MARGAQRAGLTRVPVVVKDVARRQAPRTLLELALIENIQREDLNPIDEATAYRRLADEFHLTQEAIAVGGRQGSRDRRQHAAAAEAARRSSERRGSPARSSMGHARALLALPTDAVQLQVAREVKTRGLSVRETEALVKSALEGHEVGGADAAPRERRDTARRPHARRGRQAEDSARHARAHHPQGARAAASRSTSRARTS